MSTPTQSLAPTAAASVSPPPTDATLTYVNLAYGYSFQYPATWYLSEESAPAFVILHSYDLASIPPEDAGKPVPIDKLKVFFSVHEGVDKPPEQWLAESREQASVEQNLPPPKIIAQTAVQLGGKDGLMEITESEAYGVRDRSYYIALGEGRVFAVNAVPADSEVWPEFEKVLATMRFAR